MMSRRGLSRRLVEGYAGAVGFLASVLVPGLAWASEETGHGFSLKVHGFYLINFILFVALLVYFAGPAIAKVVKERSEKTARRLTAARAEADRAGAEAAGARQKVEGMEEEKAALLHRMDEEGKALEARIQARSAEEAEKIRRSAASALENEKARLEKQLRTEIALEALARAEAELEATWQTLPHDRFMAEFGEALKSLPSLGQEKRA